MFLFAPGAKAACMTNLNKVDFSELCEGGWTEDIKDGDDILMVKMAEELDFAERAEAEHAMVERRDALDRDFAPRWDVNCGAKRRFAHDRKEMRCRLISIY